MAHLTNNAVDSVLAYLSKLVKDEATLLKGVEGDVQFIKDEMDSMNGFLLYLTKTKTPHDDQVRAWMKQVRDLAYVADDCVKLYRRDLTPPEPGLWPWLCHIPTWLRTTPRRHSLAKKIRKLKERVREVGERRERYDVTITRSQSEDGRHTPHEPSLPLPTRRAKTYEQIRCGLLEVGLRVLEDGHGLAEAAADDPLQSLKRHFLANVKETSGAVSDDDVTIMKNILDKLKMKNILDILDMQNILKKLDMKNILKIDSAKMLLRAACANPYGIIEFEFEDFLLANLKERSGAVSDDDVAHHVMVFCYSKLSTHQKSCLQYLTTFNVEKSISRTCLIRRWLAEGTVAREQGEPDDDDECSMEEAGERCFNELVFRGFIHPAPLPPTGLKMKSCIVDPSVKKFISSISKTDNFIDDLPTHLKHQIEIRELAQEPPQAQRKPWWWCPPPTCITTICGHHHDDGKPLPPMDEIVKLLKDLPEEYRLNVLDLGGCTGLKMSHLTTICDLVPSLKYLSLRNTNVFWLPKQMNNLLHLETLDIRDTRVQANATRDIFLHELKHLLAGYISADGAQRYTVKIPNKIGKNTEILKHVQIINDGRQAQAQLRRIESLKRLRKLGVVLSGSQKNMEHLLRAISKRSKSLRSLSVWITEPPSRDTGDGGFVTVDTSGGAPFLPLPPPEKLESLNLKCLRGNSSRGHIPQWIKQLQLLTKITLRHSLLTKDGLSELGKLTSLRCLRLRRESYIEDEVILKKGEFMELRFLLLDHVSNNTKTLGIEPSAAPMLKNIVWNMDSNMAAGIMSDTTKHGIKNHPNVEVTINSQFYR